MNKFLNCKIEKHKNSKELTQKHAMLHAKYLLAYKMNTNTSHNDGTALYTWEEDLPNHIL